MRLHKGIALTAIDENGANVGSAIRVKLPFWSRFLMLFRSKVTLVATNSSLSLQETKQLTNDLLRRFEEEEKTE